MIRARAGIVALALLAGCGEEGSDRRAERSSMPTLETDYDLSNLQVPRDQIHRLLERDAIPALIDPALEPGARATWLESDDRVIEIEIGGEAVAAPLRILTWHEVANLTVGGEPVAATYCPLCDSATLMSRVVRPDGREPEVLEFGVSGALYNSNVLMYDRTHLALWSQLGMEAVSGPLAGTRVDLLPVSVVPWHAFRDAHPDGRVISVDTGYDRRYDAPAYQSYFEDPDPHWTAGDFDDALEAKTLGVGIRDGSSAWFITREAIGDGYALETPSGTVRLERSAAGIAVLEAPEGVLTAQTFYYAWSSFQPGTTVVHDDAPQDPE